LRGSGFQKFRLLFAKLDASLVDHPEHAAKMPMMTGIVSMSVTMMATKTQLIRSVCNTCIREPRLGCQMQISRQTVTGIRSSDNLSPIIL